MTQFECATLACLGNEAILAMPFHSSDDDTQAAFSSVVHGRWAWPVVALLV
jgi:hypothetical protein